MKYTVPFENMASPPPSYHELPESERAPSKEGACALVRLLYVGVVFTLGLGTGFLLFSC